MYLASVEPNDREGGTRLTRVTDEEGSVGLVEEEPPPPAVLVPGRGLRGIVLRGSAWTLVGYGSSQVLRLASNLVLTRLLAPEIFGVGAIVALFLQALEMFSDIGLGSSIIRSPRGDDPAFFNTVWTIQIVRGLLLWLGSVLIAWPVALAYGTPLLAWLLPVAGLASVVQGFISTAMHRCNRHICLGWLTTWDLCSQTATIAATLLLARTWPTVWSLIGGGIIGAAAKTVLSFVMLPGSENRLAWDRAASSEILHFGKWLTLGTILTFFTNSGDRLILGFVLTKAALGVYSIAFFMSQAVPTAVRSLSGRIFFPLYARLGELGAADVRGRIYRLQAALLLTVLPPICALVVWGPRIIDFLYDRRYHEAGWMLRILAAGTIAAVITANTGSVLLAKGNSFLYMNCLAVRSCVLLGSMLVGGRLGGTQGLIVGVALEPLICYPIQALATRRYGAWMPWLDLAALVGSAALVALGLAIAA
jgi:O-antigen/teichoic acid export membrane protein